MRHHDLLSLSTILILAAIGAAVAGPVFSQGAPTPEHRFSIEAFWPGGTLVNGDRIDTGLGLRSTYRWGRRWAIEGGASFFEHSRSDELRLDLTARYVFKETKKFHYFALAGPTFERRDSTTSTFDPETFELLPGSERRRSDDVYLGVGLGFEFDVSKRFFLRPEILAQTNDGGLTPLDLRFGFGFRF